jgi:hypothetical protein
MILLGTSGCGSRSLDSSAATDAGADVSGDAGPPIEAVYEVSYFRLGLTARDGTESADAWKKYGFDLDGICTTEDQSKTSAGTCMRVDGSKPVVLADGDACIDNNFGSQLVPLIKALGGDVEKNLIDGVKKGGATLAIRIRDLAPSGADDHAPGALFAAKGAGGTAALDGHDVLDVDQGSVDSNDLEKPLAVLDGHVEIVDGARIWKGKADLLALPVVFIADATGTMPVRGLRLEIDLGTGEGTVGGYSLETDITKVLTVILAKQKICPGDFLYTQAQSTVAQAADMPAILPHDTTKTCESISLGLGFELVPATLGKVIPTPPPPADPCAK